MVMIVMMTTMARELGWNNDGDNEIVVMMRVI